jgi:predicted nucleic-acid-binding Zn-ribbon protein
MGAVALSGAVIKSQKGSLIVYSKKCEKCGSIHPGDTTTSISSSSATKLNSSFRCVKCGNNQKIIIQGG